MRDPYSVLGVGRDADAAQVKSAFRRLAKKWHPDSNKDNPEAQARFAEAAQAYEILGDAERRKAFDRGEIDAEGKPRFQGFAGGGSGQGSGNPFSGFEDIFGRGGHFEFRSGGPRGGTGAGGAEDVLRDLFGGAFAGQPKGASGGQSRPAETSVDVAVTLEEIVSASKVTVKLPDGRTIALQLKKDARAGQVMRLKGQGPADPMGRRGDVMAKIVLKPHPRFLVEGDNLHGDIDVTLQQAVEGARLPFETLDGKVAVTIPEWSGGDKVLRIKGRGLPRQAGGRGDLLVHVRPVLDPVRDGWIANALKQVKS